MESMNWAYFGQIFELFIERYKICTHDSQIGISRVIRVQRRYVARIWPMESITWAHFGQIFELFIERYRICTHVSHIEYVLMIHLVKIS